MHGAASDLDSEGRAIFFGGGAPWGGLCEETTALVLSGGSESPDGQFGDLSAAWESWPVVGERPSARQGVRGVVFDDRFIIFGGRGNTGNCLNDLWALNLEPGRSGHRMWNELSCQGQPPSPRVWYGACHAVYGQWFVIGGSEWQFEEPANPHEYSTLYVLELTSMCWSTLAQPAGAPTSNVPPLVVAPCLVPLGSRQLLYFGGTMPHKVGQQRLLHDNLRHWQQWYQRLDRPCVFDRSENTWSQRTALVCPAESRDDQAAEHSEPAEYLSEVYLRSHSAAVYLPERGSVVVLGGARYFTGEYFHDLLELRLPTTTIAAERALSTFVEVPTLQDRIPRFMRPPGGSSRLTRGLKGRLRSMARDGRLDLEQYHRILDTF